jgi:hypothetical protein
MLKNVKGYAVTDFKKHDKLYKTYFQKIVEYSLFGGKKLINLD